MWPNIDIGGKSTPKEFKSLFQTVETRRLVTQRIDLRYGRSGEGARPNQTAVKKLRALAILSA